MLPATPVMSACFSFIELKFVPGKARGEYLFRRRLRGASLKTTTKINYLSIISISIKFYFPNTITRQVLNLTDQSRYLPHVDGLRAIAVLTVLLFHLNVPGFSGGFVGVDIFFVISGYLITRLLLIEREGRGTINFRTFYGRRVRRLMPALFATFLLTALAASLIFSPAHLQRFGGALASAMLSVSNFYFWQEAGYFDTSEHLRPLLHTWSLSVEEQFYLFWPAMIALIYRFSFQSNFVKILFGLAALSLLMSVALLFAHNSEWSKFLVESLEGTSNVKNTMFFLLPFRVFEFCIGAYLVNIGLNKYSGYGFANALFVLGAVLITFSVMFIDDGMLFPGVVALIPCIGAALIIVSGGTAPFASVIRHKSVVWIGLISYSLYLVHWPIIVFWEYSLGPMTVLDRLIILAMCFLLAFVFYRFIETPFRRLPFKGSFAGPGSYILIALVVVGVGHHMWSNQGWAWRIDQPEKVQKVASAADFHREHYGGAGYPSVGMVFGSGVPDILVVGDSHAQQYLEGVVKEVAAPNQYAVASFYGVSCIHLPQFTRKSNKGNFDISCPKITQDAINTAKAYPDDPPIVILSHSWLSQIRRAALLDKEGQQLDKELRVEDVIDGLLEFADAIRPARLAVLGALPGTGGLNLFDELNRPRPFKSSDDSFEELSYTAIDEKRMWFNRTLESVAQETEAFIFLDPFNALCKNKRCSNFGAQGQYIYSDLSHLSKYGSRQVVRHFYDDLVSMLE